MIKHFKLPKNILFKKISNIDIKELVLWLIILTTPLANESGLFTFELGFTIFPSYLFIALSIILFFREKFILRIKQSQPTDHINYFIFGFILVIIISIFQTRFTADISDIPIRVAAATITKNFYGRSISQVISIIVMALLYLSVINTITDSKKLMRSITICIVTATLFSIYGLLSYILIKLGHASIVKSLGYFIGNSPAAATFGDRGVRIQALFPEPLIFGSYLLTIIPVTIGCLFTKTKYPKFLILSAFFILLLTAIFTFSRGCWLGLLFCFLILAVIFWPKLTAKQIKIIFLGIFIFLCLFLMARFKYIQKDLVKIKRLTIEQVTALKNINYYIDLNKQINSGDKNKIEKIPGLEWSTIMRVNDIVAGIAMAKSHPFFGVGWGNYIFNYLEYDPRFMSWWWMDMPNSDNRPGTPICPNLFVSVLAETGFIGLIAFLAFLGSVFWVFILAIRKKFNNGLIFLVSGYFAAFCAVIITYQFYSTLYFAFFWIMLGMGIAAVNISLTSSKQ